MADLSAVDLAAYAQQRQKAASQYGTSLAQLNYQRGVTNQSYGNTQYDLRNQYARARSRLPGGFAGRGLLNSGIYGQALTDFNTDYQTALQRALQGYQQTQGGYDVSAQGLSASYNNALADIETQQALRRQQLAAQLESVL